MKFKDLYKLCFLIPLAIIGCSDDKDELSGALMSFPYKLSIDSTGISNGKFFVENKTVHHSIQVKTDAPIWEAEVRAGKNWCEIDTIDLTTGKIQLLLEENKTTESRSAVISIFAGSSDLNVIISQNGYKPSVSFDTDMHLLQQRDTTIIVQTSSNVKYNVVIPDSVSSWIHCDGLADKVIKDVTDFTFTIDANDELNARNAVVVFKYDTLSWFLPIKQLGAKAEIIVDETPIELAYDNLDLSVEVLANLGYAVKLIDKATGKTPDWISEQQSRALQSTIHRFVLTKNLNVNSRTSILSFSGKNIEKTIQIIQKGYQPVIDVDETRRDINANDISLSIEVESDAIYNIAIKNINNQENVDWLTYVSGKPTTAMPEEKVTSTLVFNVKNNPVSQYREAKIILSSEMVQRQIIIRQLGAGYFTIVNPENKTVKLLCSAQEFNVSVESNVDYTLKLPEWIKRKNAMQGTTTFDSTYTFVVEANGVNGINRTADIIFIAAGAEHRINVSQPKEMTYDGLIIQTATASSNGPIGDGDRIEATFDGDMNTYYNSDYGVSAWKDVVLTYYLAGSSQFSGLTYYKRTTGCIRAFDLQIAKTENPQDSDFETVQSYEITTPVESYDANLDIPQSGVTAVRLYVRSTHSSSKHIDCKEIVFKGKTGQNTPYLHVEREGSGNIANSGGTILWNVTSNLNVTLKPIDSWISTTPRTQRMLPPREEQTFSFIVASNTEDTRRIGRLQILVDEVVKDTIEFIQQGNMSITTNTWQNGGEGNGDGAVELIIDGNINTYWHSSWSPNFNMSASNPAILTFNWQNAKASITGLKYWSRQPSGGNGNFGEFEVYTKSTGENTYTLRKTFNNQQAVANGALFELTNQVENVESLQIKVKSGLGGFASAAQIEFIP